MAEFTVRDAVQDDAAFLTELAALFGQGPDGSASSEWPRRDSDFGLIAQDEDDHPIAAAWWRLSSGPKEGEPSPDMREIFLGVVPARQGEGIGSELLDRLIDVARANPALRRLVGRIVEDPKLGPKIEEMLVDRGFTANRNYVTRGLGVFWVLDVEQAAPA